MIPNHFFFFCLLSNDLSGPRDVQVQRWVPIDPEPRVLVDALGRIKVPIVSLRSLNPPVIQPSMRPVDADRLPPKLGGRLGRAHVGTPTRLRDPTWGDREVER